MNKKTVKWINPKSLFEGMVAWVRRHPILTVIFSFIYGGGVEKFSEMDAGGIGSVGAIGWIISIPILCVVFGKLFQWRHGGTAVILAMVLLIPTHPFSTLNAEPLPKDKTPTTELAGGLVIAGVVVVCVGGYCAYRLNKFCKKKFGKKDDKTNAPSSSVSSLLNGGTGSSAASVCWIGSGSCVESAAVAPPENVFTFMVAYDVGPMPILVPISYAPESEMVSKDEFNEQLAIHGVQWRDETGHREFAIDGHPVDENEMPFIIGKTFEEGIHMVMDAPWIQPIVVETSNSSNEDGDWTAILHTSISASTPIIVQDTPTGDQNYYRLRLE